VTGESHGSSRGFTLEGHHGLARAIQQFMLAMILLSSTAHPWYLLWALVLMPLHPGAAVWVLSLTLPWGYAVLGDVVAWQAPWWVSLAAYTPVAAALAWETVVQWRPAAGPARPARPG
jgi:hypothetical protein